MFPELLMPGNTVGIYSPSGSVNYSSRMDLFTTGIQKLKSYGFEVTEAPHTRSRFFHMAATGEDKASDIHLLFANSDVRAIFPSVGGHTATQLLPYLNLSVVEANPKIFIGFSDSAIIAAYISDRTSLITFHSAVDITFGFSRFGTDESPMSGHGSYTVENLWRMVCYGQSFTHPYSEWAPINDGDAEGTLIGGNLTGLISVLGTPYELDWNRKILYWEAVDPPHVMARSLTQLKNAGVFEKIAGMVIGKVSHLRETFYGEDEIMHILEFVRYSVGKTNIPILAEVDFGHDVENLMMPNGAAVYLSVNKNNYELKISV